MTAKWFEHACHPQYILTTIQVAVSADAGLFSYFPGQFAFLQFPTVSTLQWHPFTISSAPSSNRITFHIKNTGPKAFTGQLAEQARLMRESHRSIPSARSLYDSNARAGVY